MTIRPELEEQIRTLASAKGVSVEAFLQQVVDEKRGQARQRKLSAEEWTRQFDELADSVPSAPPIPDEALSREYLNPDRL